MADDLTGDVRDLSQAAASIAAVITAWRSTRKRSGDAVTVEDVTRIVDALAQLNESTADAFLKVIDLIEGIDDARRRTDRLLVTLIGELKPLLDEEALDRLRDSTNDED